MELRTSRKPDAVDWLFLLVTLLLAGIHLYLGLFAPFVPGDRETQFVGIALALLVGPLFYFTTYWRPVFYLLGAAFALYLGAVWLFAGMEFLAFGVAAGVVATTFVVLAVYLFLRDETRATGA
ncbi:hypothetical protein [Halorussus amylolyticus]|uniref:hypothetical protein n=1 Tax=Halorussus amylolyticus TaxID=1126242 RepID=UPI00104BA5AB|nr:hypothetical protein [Halorussus amylolyticus]